MLGLLSQTQLFLFTHFENNCDELMFALFTQPLEDSEPWMSLLLRFAPCSYLFKRFAWTPTLKQTSGQLTAVIKLQTIKIKIKPRTKILDTSQQLAIIFFVFVVHLLITSDFS